MEPNQLVDTETTTDLNQSEAQPGNTQAAPSTEWIEFRNSDIHGRGGFARKLIPGGTQVIEYVGRTVTKAESEKLCSDNNEYIFDLNEEFDLDGNVEWNPARLINHSCNPNCYAEQDGDRIFIFAQREIQPGEELSFNYGFSLEGYQDFPCLCADKFCVGFIVAEEYHALVREENSLPKPSRR